MSKSLQLTVLKRNCKRKRKKVNAVNNSTDTETSKYFHSEANTKDICNTLCPSSNQVSEHELIITDISKKLKFDNKSSTNYILNEKLVTWFPNDWKKQLHNIRQMRKYYTAPVDKMGCHKCADKLLSDSLFRYQTLVALMLSSQTKDQTTYLAMQRLKDINCTPQNITSLPDAELGKLIYPVSFWKRKVQYLKKTSQILLQNYDGDIPNNIEELCNLPGVGKKMAHICMQVAWNIVSGIGVDTHVHRISNRLKWVPSPTKTPEQTRIILESWLPKELWIEINTLFVGFGQEICQPRKPKCSKCINNTLCPYNNEKYQF